MGWLSRSVFASCLLWSAPTMAQAGNIDAARATLAAAERASGSRSTAAADALDRLIDLERTSLEIETHAADVEAQARRLLDLRRSLDGERALSVAHALQDLGFALTARFAQTEALAAFQQAQTLVDAHADADATTRAEAALHVAIARRNLRRDMDVARDALRAALADPTRLSPRGRAKGFLALAGAETWLQHNAETFAAVAQAEAALVELNQPRDPLHVDALRARAYAALADGKPADALSRADQAIAAAELASPYSPLMHLIALQSRGQIEQRIGHLESAAPYFERALALPEVWKLNGGFSASLVEYELCGNFARRALPDKARDHCGAAVRGFEALATAPVTELGSAYITLSGVLIDAGDEDAARPAIAKAMALARQSGPALAPLLFAAEINLADIHLHHGEFVDAQRVLEGFLSRISDPGDFAIRETRTPKVALAAALWGQGRFAAAFAQAAAAEQSARNVREVFASDVDEHRAQRALAQVHGGEEWMLAIAAADRMPEHVAAAWGAIMDVYRVQTAVAIRRLATARASADPQRQSLWQHWQARSATLTQARVDLASHPDAAHESTFETAERDFERADLALASATNSDPRGVLKRARGPTQVPPLPERAGLLRFVEIEVDGPSSFSRTHPPVQNQLIALFVRSGSAPVAVAMGAADAVRDAAERWYRLASTAGADAAELSQASRTLRRMIIDPLPGFGEVERVFVVPSAVLSRVNFAALERDDGSYLIESGPEFHSLEHERDLVRAAAPRGASSVLLTGAPSFGTAVDGSEMDRESCRGRCGTTFTPLPGARDELRSLADILTPLHVTVSTLTDAAATEHAVREALHGRQVLHFATHGVYLGEHDLVANADERGLKIVDAQAHDASIPSVPLSALALGNANRGYTRSDDDGLLTSEEIAVLDLSGVQWAVLSACETALGPDLQREGVGGLRRAFALAGAHTMIMSLWRVSDKATTEFMRALYRVRFEQRADTVRSMREAMRSTLAARRARGEPTSPYYWGGFIASGDWR